MIRRLTTLALAAVLLCRAAPAADAPVPVEQALADAAKSHKVTVVHFWAPWCSNCRHELANGGWSGFVASNPDVNFVFVTVWSAKDGRDVLEKNGVGAEPNVQLLVDPSGAHKQGDPVTVYLGMPVSWIPTTWVYRDGNLCYALNYGELHFPVLKQLIADTTGDW
jgi:thiol-disulfide isomerase/thioredoxin